MTSPRNQDHPSGSPADTQPIAAGALARVVRATPDLTHEGFEFPAGHEFEVAEFISAEISEDGVAFYWGNANGGGYNVAVAAADVEQAMSVEDMQARRVPSRAEMLDAVSSALCGLCEDEFDTDEAELDGDAVVVYGQTRHGLRFAVRLSVGAPFEVDL